MGTEGTAAKPATVPAGVPDAPEGYEGLVRLDEGGFAVVYRALDTRFDRTVALKILRADSLDERQLRRFNTECLATGRVSSHPNIVTVYDAGTTPARRPWLAMELCPGGSLAQKVTRLGPLPVAEVISIGVRLCSALTAAHEAGILHRDVKPHNVLLTAYGEPALADFGIASVRIGEVTTGATTAYTVVHAAPELLEGRAGTTAADIYSLGSTLYTLLAGEAPYAREARTGLAPLVSRILRGDLPVIARPGVPPQLEKLLRGAMAAQPDDRPASAAELGASLAALGRHLIADAGTGSGGSLPVARRAEPPTSARRLLVSLGGVLGLLLAAFMTVGFSVHGSGQPAIPQSAKAQAATQAATQAGVTTAGVHAAGALVADRYAPTGVVVTRGHHKGELTVSWHQPLRPAVMATVVYQATGATRARAIVSYSGRQEATTVTLHGLPSRRRVCLFAAHVVSIQDQVTDAVSHRVCAVPR